MRSLWLFLLVGFACQSTATFELKNYEKGFSFAHFVESTFVIAGVVHHSGHKAVRAHSKLLEDEVRTVRTSKKPIYSLYLKEAEEIDDLTGILRGFKAAKDIYSEETQHQADLVREQENEYLVWAEVLADYAETNGRGVRMSVDILSLKSSKIVYRVQVRGFAPFKKKGVAPPVHEAVRDAFAHYVKKSMRR